MNRRTSSVVLLILLTVGSAAAVAVAGSQATARAAAFFPKPGNWEAREPASLGLDPAKLADAIAFANANEFVGRILSTITK